MGRFIVLNSESLDYSRTSAYMPKITSKFVTGSDCRPRYASNSSITPWKRRHGTRASPSKRYVIHTTITETGILFLGQEQRRICSNRMLFYPHLVQNIVSGFCYDGMAVSFCHCSSESTS